MLIFGQTFFLELSLVLLLGCRLSFFIADDTASLCYQRCLSRETFFVASLFEPFARHSVVLMTRAYSRLAHGLRQCVPRAR